MPWVWVNSHWNMVSSYSICRSAIAPDTSNTAEGDVPPPLTPPAAVAVPLLPSDKPAEDANTSDDDGEVLIWVDEDEASRVSVTIDVMVLPHVHSKSHLEEEK